MTTLQEKIAVMQGAAEGRVVQVKSIVDGSWNETPVPEWRWHDTEYRLKPEPPRELLVGFTADGDVADVTKPGGLQHFSLDYRLFREVVE